MVEKILQVNLKYPFDFLYLEVFFCIVLFYLALLLNIPLFVYFEKHLENIIFYLNDTGSPALIKDSSDNDSIFIVMPMKA